MARHLTPTHLQSALARGKAVECFLGGGQFHGNPTIRWVSIHRKDGQVVASLYEAYDPRDPEYVDIYSFRSVEEVGDEPIEVATFSSLDAALEHASRSWGADRARYTNQGVAESEYEDYLASL